MSDVGSAPMSLCSTSATKLREQALLLGEPDVFFTAPGYEGQALVLLRLPAVDVERLEELVTDAWRMRGEF